MSINDALTPPQSDKEEIPTLEELVTGARERIKDITTRGEFASFIRPFYQRLQEQAAFMRRGSPAWQTSSQGLTGLVLDLDEPEIRITGVLPDPDLVESNQEWNGTIYPGGLIDSQDGGRIPFGLGDAESLQAYVTAVVGVSEAILGIIDLGEQGELFD